MTHYIDKSAIVAGIEDKINKYTKRGEESDAKRDGYGMYWGGVLSCLNEIRTLCDTLEVKEVDIDKLCEFRKNIGFAYPEGAREYQKQLACYRQGIEDAIKAQKGENI